ncbi:MAG: DUF4870 domain-containing protein [Campylobacteraceae bacterium]|jgi:uncharacterized membrane protein|nr:DUF4870 domain-containing protein [Campylobacteraceae bacterium]
MVAESNLKSSKDMAFVVYILYICSYFTGITSIVGVIIAYVKRGETEEEWLNDHFYWQINTFWILFIAAIIGFILMFFFIGFVILIAMSIWGIYRTIKGMIRLGDNRSPYN